MQRFTLSLFCLLLAFGSKAQKPTIHQKLGIVPLANRTIQNLRIKSSPKDSGIVYQQNFPAQIAYPGCNGLLAPPQFSNVFGPNANSDTTIDSKGKTIQRSANIAPNIDFMGSSSYYRLHYDHADRLDSVYIRTVGEPGVSLSRIAFRYDKDNNIVQTIIYPNNEMRFAKPQNPRIFDFSYKNGNLVKLKLDKLDQYIYNYNEEGFLEKVETEQPGARTDIMTYQYKFKKKKNLLVVSKTSQRLVSGKLQSKQKQIYEYQFAP